MQFTKLFNSILDSTIWQEPPATKLVWITMLAMVDRGGEVHTSIPGLAKRAGVTLPECESALQCLLSPDPYSRTKDHDGRRIAEIDGGFALLNHAKYRALLSAEERREYNRKKQAEYRAKLKASKEHVNDTSMTVNHNKQNAHSTEAEAEAEAEAEEERVPKTRPHEVPQLEAVKKYAASAPFPISEACAIAFHDTQEAAGWITKHGHSIADWRASLRRYASAWNENEKSRASKNDPRKQKSIIGIPL